MTDTLKNRQQKPETARDRTDHRRDTRADTKSKKARASSGKSSSPPPSARASATRAGTSSKKSAPKQGSSTKKAGQKKKRRSMRDWPTAKTADRYALYQSSVQDAVFEVNLLARMWKAAFGASTKPRVLREDFSGTGWVSCEWVRRDRQRESYAVDLDPTTHAWGRVHNLSALDDQQKARVHWVLDDVRSTKAAPKADIVAAMNFSYFIFKERAALLGYFKSVYANLEKKGLFALDIFGGSETFEDDREEEHGFEGFTYVWHQARHNPINGDYLFHIHYHFADGTKLEKAFSYDWRMWTLPEVKDLLVEAGFKKVDVYWEDSDKNGEGTGVYRIRTKGDADLAWVAYLVATK